MEIDLLQTKFVIPMFRTDIVRRSRLIDKLTAGLEKKMTLISAPAGYGKTTLLVDWLFQLGINDHRTLHNLPETAESNQFTSNTGHNSAFGDNAAEAIRAAWLSLDRNDNDPVRFLTYICAALHNADNRLAQSALALLSAPKKQIPDLPLDALINDINNTLMGSDRLILVLDDYHLIGAEKVHRAVSYLLAHGPASFHLVIATRADPPLSIASLRSKAELTELRQNDLRFTAEEAGDFLLRTLKPQLSRREVSVLVTKTEGWIAGLQLAALAIERYATNPESADIQLFINRFQGSNRYILDYLLEEVLLGQSQPIQDFLVKTSVLERLTGPLCDSLLGQSSSQEYLENMDAENLFVVPLDGDRRWYRYHRLFADLLQKRLHHQYPDQVKDLHRRASLWFEEQAAVSQDRTMMDEAIRHALAGDDPERARELIEVEAEPALMRSEVFTVLEWIESLPANMLEDRPLLAVVYAGSLLMAGRPVEEIERYLYIAERNDDLLQVQSKIQVFRALLAALKGDLDRSASFSNEALGSLSEEDLFYKSLVADNLGILSMMRGDLIGAVRALEEAAEIGRKSGNILIATGAISNLAGLHMIQGKLGRAAAVYQEALELAIDQDRRRIPIAGKALLGLAELHREWNHLQEAEQLALEGIELMSRYMDVGVLVGYLTVARIRQAQNKLNEAQQLTDKAYKLAMKFDASKMDDVLVLTYQVYLWLASGKVKEAEEWLLDYLPQVDPAEVRKGSLFDQLEDFRRMTAARVLIALKRPDEAIRLLLPLISPEITLSRNRLRILVLLAVACQAAGDERRAFGFLEQALSLGEPEGFIRTFLDEGRPMSRLLFRFVAETGDHRYAGRLLVAFADDVKGDQETRTDQSGGDVLVEALSKRELEVVALLAEGLSNREIGQRLNISLSTVKGHTSNIYGKLAANNRTQAVARARHLGILNDS